MISDSKIIKLFENHENCFYFNLREPCILSEAEKTLIKRLENHIIIAKEELLFPIKVITNLSTKTYEGICKGFVLSAETIENNYDRGGVIVQKDLDSDSKQHATIITEYINDIYIYKPIVYTKDLCYSLSYI